MIIIQDTREKKGHKNGTGKMIIDLLEKYTKQKQN